MTQITEHDLFEALLASEDVPLYDPAKHLIAPVAAKRWGVSNNAAAERLRTKAPQFGLKAIDVRGPSGRKILAYVPDTKHD